MKHKIIKFLLLLLSIVPAMAQDESPKIMEVAEKFYSTYDLRYSDYSYAQFDKVNRDWYVRSQKVSGRSLIPGERILFYDGTRKVFNELTEFEMYDSIIKIDPRDYIQEYDEYNYNIQPFYGYQGWYNDVIKYYEAFGDHTENEIYGLARAYAAKANVASSNQSMDGPPNEIFTFPLGKNSFSPEQRKAFLENVDKAITNYKLLSTINPAFETRVGKVGVKHSNEIIYRYHILRSFDFDYASKIKLPNNVYADSIIQSSVALLNSMPPNAIFLSFGDNDFYPLLYAQYLGTRQDIYIINYSLLGNDRFIYLSKFKWFEASPAIFNSDTALYKGTINDYILISESDSSISIKDFLQKIGQEDGQENVVTINAGTIILNDKSEKVQVSLANSRYLLKNHWILLDILDNLNGRPLVMLNDTYDFPGLVPYLKKKGDFFTWEP
jgi:hypothetical protein